MIINLNNGRKNRGLLITITRISTPLLRLNNKYTGGKKHYSKCNNYKFTGKAVSKKQSRSKGRYHKTLGDPSHFHATHLLSRIIARNAAADAASAFTGVEYIYDSTSSHYTQTERKRV